MKCIKFCQLKIERETTRDVFCTHKLKHPYCNCIYGIVFTQVTQVMQPYGFKENDTGIVENLI